MVNRYDPELDSETWIRSETGQAVFYSDYEALEAKLAALVKALQKADEFMRNGIELGYIKMPDKDTLDSAHETPGIVSAALAQVKGG